MAHYLLMYDVVADYEERRATFRDAHLRAAWDSAARGELLLAGALMNPFDSAVPLLLDFNDRVEHFQVVHQTS